MEKVKGLGIPEWNDTFVRIAIQEEKSPLFIATPERTELDELAGQTFRAVPDDLARLGFAVAHALDPESPQVQDLSAPLSTLSETIAGALKNAKHPLIICGASCGSRALVHAAANIARALCRTGSTAFLSFPMPECNSLGLGLLGAGGIQKAFASAAKEKAETVIILENDLFRRAEEAQVQSFLKGVSHIVTIDSFSNRTTEQADAVLPSGTFAESDGTLVNSEGRAQRFFRVFVPEGTIEESWKWICAMLSVTENTRGGGWKTLHDISAALAEELEIFTPVPEAAPPPEFREKGQKVPRQSHRYSGRTSLAANKTIHEPAPPEDPDSPFSFSMEGSGGRPPAALVPRYWAPGWNSVQALNKFQTEVGGQLQGGDPGRRLIESSTVNNASFFDDIPRAFSVRKNEWLFVPLFHLFGSEELSAMAPAIKERAPQPYLAINKEDAESLGLTEGDLASAELHGKSYRLPLKVSASLPRGVAGLPAGLPSLEAFFVPSWGRISKAEVKQ